MSTLNREAYVRLLEGDLEWLLKQPRTLEREHIACLLMNAIKGLDYTETKVSPSQEEYKKQVRWTFDTLVKQQTDLVNILLDRIK